MHSLSNEALNEIKYLLDDRYRRYNHFDFIETDPIQIPHSFARKEDVEIAAFLTASIAWGQRVTIIKNARRLMSLLDNAPYDFICNATESDLESLRGFVHRTFNSNDCMFFIRSLQNIYQHHDGLEAVFDKGFKTHQHIAGTLTHFRKVFLQSTHEKRNEKHLSDVSRNSSAKRLNMLLRWLVRHDEAEVDLGIWKNIPTSALMLPLDVHTGDVGRAIGILSRTQNDWKAVEEITDVLRQFDPHDPVKYDYALFGIGVFGEKDKG
ncbi:MAG: TIGR02757 family protein [Paludibacteraceae bacterium]|nr:TIGR02757 family protein [Paludibacteraceae bacterium]